MSSEAEDQRVLSKADRRRFFAAVFAHGTARLLSKAVSAPLDRIKICQQVATIGSGSSHVLGGRATPSFGARELARQIRSSQGTLAFWRGAGTHIFGISLGSFTRLAVLNRSQMWAVPLTFKERGGFDAYRERCTFLFFAGAAALTVSYPLDVAYTCLAADMGPRREYRGLLHFMKEARREQGIRFLYRGYPLCILSSIPFLAVATVVHDFLARRLLHRMGQQPPVNDRTGPDGGDAFWLTRSGAPAHLFPWNLLVGAASGFAAQTVTYPLDTVRRAWQHTCTASRESDPKTMMEVYAQIRSRGWKCFYAGYGVNAMKLAPELFMLSSVYQLINMSGSFV